MLPVLTSFLSPRLDFKLPLALPLKKVLLVLLTAIVTSNESVIHLSKSGAFSLKTRQRHKFPLFEEKVASVFAGSTDLLELLFHELALVVADAL